MTQIFDLIMKSL